MWLSVPIGLPFLVAVTIWPLPVRIPMAVLSSMMLLVFRLMTVCYDLIANGRGCLFGFLLTRSSLNEVLVVLKA